MSKEEKSSHHQILRSSSIMGGASVINVIFGLIRMKAAAVLLGPTGVGLIGFLQNLITTASTISAIGSSNVGTRQIAEAVGRNEQQDIDAGRRALFWGTIVLGATGAFVFWLFREELAALLLSDTNKSDLVGLAAIGVFFTVVTGSQSALFRGLRRISDLAKITVFSSVWGTLLGVSALFFLNGSIALIAFLLISPITTFLIGIWYALKLPALQQKRTPLVLISQQFSVFVRLGLAFMIASLAAPIGQLFVRSLLQSELGEESLGYFQASWTISMTYIGFVLSAMGADYYPRLTANIHESEKATKIVNEQASVAILLSSPVMLAMISLAPFLITLLYSTEFSEASNILRWQILGDTLKIVSWPLGFVLLAAGKGRLVLITEFIAVGVFSGTSYIFVPFFGVQGAGLAYMSMYLVHLPMMYYCARLIIGFKFEISVVKDMLILIALALLIVILSFYNQLLGTLIGSFFMLVVGLLSFSRLLNIIGTNNKLGAIIARIGNLMQSRK